VSAASEIHLLTLRDVRTLLDELGAGPKRALGQNFVVEPNTIRQIVRLAGVEPGDLVVEIGPGLGSLTLGLIEAGASVIAVEKDDRLAESLRRRIGDVHPGSLEVRCADATRIDWDVLTSGRTSKVVANLPYNVATTLIIDLLDQADDVESITAMVQREVADRLAAEPGTPAYGLPSVRVAVRGRARRLAVVPPEVFWPRPRVESAVVRVDRHADAVEIPTGFERLVAAGFGQRRKTLRRALAGVTDPGAVADALGVCGLGPDARAEELSVDHWLALSRALGPS